MAAALSLVYSPAMVADQGLIVELTAPCSAGVSFAGRSKYKVVKAYAAAPTSPINLLTAYVAIYGPLSTGQKVFWRITTIDPASGLAGARIDGSAIVT